MVACGFELGAGGSGQGWNACRHLWSGRTTPARPGHAPRKSATAIANTSRDLHRAGRGRARARGPVPGAVRTPATNAFVDFTGYSRLTEEHGDEAAARLAPASRPSSRTTRGGTGAGPGSVTVVHLHLHGGKHAVDLGRPRTNGPGLPATRRRGLGGQRSERSRHGRPGRRRADLVLHERFFSKHPSPMLAASVHIGFRASSTTVPPVVGRGSNGWFIPAAPIP